jgi:hypothetical protein
MVFIAADEGFGYSSVELTDALAWTENSSML